MSEYLLPGAGKTGRGIDRRLRHVERRPASPASTADMEQFPFGGSGAVAVVETPRPMMGFSGIGVGAVLGLTTAGTTTTTVRLLKNGVAVTGSAISLTSGETDSGLVYFTVSWVKLTDRLSCEVTAAGAGAEDWNYDLFFRRA